MLLKDYGLIKFFFILVISIIVQSCASIQKPVTLDISQWKNEKEKTVAIYIKPLPTPYTHKAGAQGLLDVAINNAVASTLTEHVKSLNMSEFLTIKQELNQLLLSDSITVKFLDEQYTLPKLEKLKDKQANHAKLDYRPLQQSLDADQLLIIDVFQLGTIRSYYGFIPTSAPSGTFSALAQLIDLSTNEIYWYHPVSTNKIVDGKWDENPDYPNLTKAIYEALEDGRIQLISPLK